MSTETTSQPTTKQTRHRYTFASRLEAEQAAERHRQQAGRYRLALHFALFHVPAAQLSCRYAGGVYLAKIYQPQRCDGGLVVLEWHHPGQSPSVSDCDYPAEWARRTIEALWGFNDAGAHALSDLARRVRDLAHELALAEVALPTDPTTADDCQPSAA